MQTNTVTKLDREKRASIMVSEAAKSEFDGYKSGLYDWQLFNRMLEVYRLYGQQIQRSEDVA